MRPTTRPRGSRAANLTASLIALPLLLTACSTGEDQQIDDGTLSGCILNSTDGALTDAEADTLRSSFDYGFRVDDATDVQNLYSFEDLNLTLEAASAVYDAAGACGVDFDAIIADQVFDILGNHGDSAQACLNASATPENVREFTLAVMDGADSSDTTGSIHALWQAFRACEPGATSHTGAAKNDPNNGVFDDDGNSAFPSPQPDPSETTGAVEACYDYALEEQATLLDMLYAGEISDRQYNEMMAESGKDCIDLR